MRTTTIVLTATSTISMSMKREVHEKVISLKSPSITSSQRICNTSLNEVEVWYEGRIRRLLQYTGITEATNPSTLNYHQRESEGCATGNKRAKGDRNNWECAVSVGTFVDFDF